MNIKPIGNRILIKPIKVKEKTFSGIILPNTGDTVSSNTGIVIATGNIDEKIIVGDTVFFRPHSGIEISNSEKKHLILEVEDILAIIE